MLYLGIWVAPDGYDRMMALNLTFVTDDGTLVHVDGYEHISFNFTSTSRAGKSSNNELSEDQVVKLEAFLTEAVEYVKVSKRMKRVDSCIFYRFSARRSLILSSSLAFCDRYTRRGSWAPWWSPPWSPPLRWRS
jgi:hypothetical protein